MQCTLTSGGSSGTRSSGSNSCCCFALFGRVIGGKNSPRDARLCASHDRLRLKQTTKMSQCRNGNHRAINFVEIQAGLLVEHPLRNADFTTFGQTYPHVVASDWAISKENRDFSSEVRMKPIVDSSGGRR